MSVAEEYGHEPADLVELVVNEPDVDTDIETIPLDTDDVPEQVRRMLWAVYRRNTRIAAAEKQAEAMRAEACRPIDQWLERERRRNDTTELVDLLTNFHAAWLEKHPKAKTIDAPGASLRSRTSDRWEYDEQAVIDYFGVGDDQFVQARYSLRKAELKKALRVDTETGEARFDGEVVPGITVHGGETTFTVSVDKPEAEPF